MNRITLTALFLFGALTLLTGQSEETVFSKTGLRLTGVWGAFANNYSFYADNNGYHIGGNIGLEFNRILYMGYSWNNLQDDIFLPEAVTTFRLRQNNFILSVMPISYKVIHPIITFQTGGGRVWLNSGPSDRVFIFQPSAGVELNIFRWFHLGLEGGYRFVTDLSLDQVTQKDVSAPFTQLSLRFGVSWGGGSGEAWPDE